MKLWLEGGIAPKVKWPAIRIETVVDVCSSLYTIQKSYKSLLTIIPDVGFYTIFPLGLLLFTAPTQFLQSIFGLSSLATKRQVITNSNIKKIQHKNISKS